jgi:alkylation response protein AidB-like acyl-CoA dehydrogenase
MFIMMNEARFKVGLQGLAIGERAYQAAREYAKDRVQGRPAGVKSGDRITIIHHPDVRRMLMTMKAKTRRCAPWPMWSPCILIWPVTTPIRRSANPSDPSGLLIPVVKGWSTEIGIEIASLGRASPWRHGLYRGNRHLPAPARLPHHHHL